MRRTVFFLLLIQSLLLTTALRPISAQYWYEAPKKRLTIGGSLVDALADFQRHGGEVDEILTPDDLAGKPPLTYGLQNGRSVFAISGSQDGGLAGLITVDGSSVEASMTYDGFLRLAPDQTGVKNRNMSLYRALFPDQDTSEYTTEAVFEYIDESGKRFLFGGSEDGKTSAFMFKKDPRTGELIYKVERDIARAKEAKAGTWVAPDESATYPVRFKMCDQSRSNCVVRNFIKKPGDEIRINPETQAIKITFNKDVLPFRNKYGNAQRLGWSCDYKGEGFYFTYREGFMGGDVRRLPNRIGSLSCDKNELCCQRTGPGQKCNFDVRDYLDDPPNMMLFALNWLTSRLDRHKQHFTLTIDPLIEDHLRVKKFENLGCIKTVQPLKERGTRGNDVPDQVYASLKSALCPKAGGRCAGEPSFTVLQITGVGEGTTLIDERTNVKLNNVTLSKVYILKSDYGTGKRGDFVGAVVDNRAGGAIISTLLNMEDQPRAPDLLDNKEQLPPENVKEILAEMEKEDKAEEIQREVLASKQRALVLFPTRHGWGYASQHKDDKKVAGGQLYAHIVLLPPSEEPTTHLASALVPGARRRAGSPPSGAAYRYGTPQATRQPVSRPPTSSPSYRQPSSLAARPPYGASSGSSSTQGPYSYSPRPYAQAPSSAQAGGAQTSRVSPYGSSPSYGPGPVQPSYGTGPSPQGSYRSEAGRYRSAPSAAPAPQTATPGYGSPPGPVSAPPSSVAGGSDYYRTAAQDVTSSELSERARYEESQRRTPLRLPIQEEVQTPTIRRTALSPMDRESVAQPMRPLELATEQEALAQQQLEEPEPVEEEKAPAPEPKISRPVSVTPSLIRKVQFRLKRQGYRINGVDGRLGPETSKAIWRFQKDVSLQPTGRIDRPLLYSLGIEADNGWHTKSVTRAHTKTRSSSTRWRPTKKQVKEVQRRLSLIGYETGPADGLMGRQTSLAVRRFQRHAGLKATGRINEEVLRRLSIR